MYEINLNKPLNVHFIGIGGISMSGLAEILLKKGFNVSGSDMNSSNITKHLSNLGANIYIGHSKENINNSIDLIVFTAAIKEDNEEFKEAIERNIPIISRAKLLGSIMNNYPYSIGVAGTHGKTTTTSMLAHILLENKKDPTISVGGILELINGNIYVGQSDYFITEACEYCNSFLEFNPYLGIVLNLEEDHLDFFKDISEIMESFKKYLQNIPENGYAVVNSDIEDYKYLIEGLNCNVVTYGSDENNSDWYPKNIVYDDLGCPTYDLYYKGNYKDTIHLGTAGKHNIYNSIASIVSANILDINVSDTKKALLDFKGSKRRFEFKGSLKGVTILDDYAHHPTEIEATLLAAKKMEFNKLWVIFQPHTYSRTKAFLKEFAKSLSLADEIIIADIYPAREKDPGDIHSKDLVKEIMKYDKPCYYFESFDEIEIFVLEHCIPNDLLITMGAGNIYIIGEDLLLG